MMKRKRICALCLAALLLGSVALAADFTDANGRAVSVENPQRVVALYGFYGDVWRIADGTLVGTTSDIPAGGDGTVELGSHTDPNMELLFSLAPDFAILAADTSEHVEIAKVLTATPPGRGWAP